MSAPDPWSIALALIVVLVTLALLSLIVGAVLERRPSTRARLAADLTRVDQHTRLLEAVGIMGLRMSMVEEGAEHLSCSEVGSIAKVLRVAGYAADADALMEYHAHGDDDIDDEHHERYLQIQAEYEQERGNR